MRGKVHINVNVLELSSTHCMSS